MATKTNFSTQFSHHIVEPFSCDTPSMTEQHFEYETNINNIISGQVQSCLPPQTAEAMYGLTITGDEYEKQLNSSAEVTSYFETLPVKAKEYFEYKPSLMLAFIQDDKNYEQAYKIGLINKDVYEAHKEALMKNSDVSLKETIKAVSTGTSAPEVTPNSVE